jgi:heme-degrading monooxygenase HmoA
MEDPAMHDAVETPLARTPEPPYYAVIFTSLRTEDDAEGYGATAAEMERLAAQQPGYLGIESVRGTTGVGITVSYWESPEAIRNWKQVTEHRLAQRMGREKWYRRYRIRVSRVERDYVWERAAGRSS